MELTSTVVAAYLRNHDVAAEELPGIITSVYTAFTKASGKDGAAVPERPEPAVPIRRSVQPDYLICLEDGKKLKMLKRYLRNTYGLTPEEYRDRWNLPLDYPMVAPNYAKRRSVLAKRAGLGRVKRRSY
jgi:predicted transcriptional regulator